MKHTYNFMLEEKGFDKQPHKEKWYGKDVLILHLNKYGLKQLKEMIENYEENKA